MYRIFADFDLGDIVGCDLNQICLGRYDIQFVFGSKTRLAVQSRVTCFDDDKIVAAWSETENWNSLAFQRLLSVNVQSCAVIDEQTLEISLSGGLRLHLHDDSDQFESIKIYRAGDGDGPVVF